MPFMEQKLLDWATDTIGTLLKSWHELNAENKTLQREIAALKGEVMHYKNGREAKNGDKVMLIPSYGAPIIGILYDAQAGNDYCNGKIAPVSPLDPMPNLKECLHLDDVLASLETPPAQAAE